MEEKSETEAQVPRRVPWVRWMVAGLLLLAAGLYGVALVALTSTADGMQNKFSSLARSKYLAFLVWQNLRVLMAYGILVVAAAVLVAPVVARWSRRGATGRWGVMWRALSCGLAMHLYFVLRLVRERPYFMPEGKFGYWWFHIFEAPPEPWRTWLQVVVFDFVPWLVLAGVVVWHGRWLTRRWGSRRMAWAGGLLGLLVAAWVVRVGVTHAHGTVAKPAEVAERPNILVIGSDSLRGDRLGYSGYQPARSDGAAAGGVSPRIDELAARSAVFDLCMTPLASTIESITSTMVSQYPHTHGIRQMWPGQQAVERVRANTEPLADVLERAGYETAAIGDWCGAIYQILPLGFNEVAVSNYDNFRVYMTQAVFLAHFVVPLYFDNPAGYRMYPEIGSFANFVTPEVVTKRVTDRLRKGAGQRRPFFWHVFYSCNHLPYRSPAPYHRLFADPAYTGKNRTGVDFDIDQFICGTSLEDKWKALPPAEMAQTRALYDGCTRMFDDCVGKILDELREQGLAERTIVVVTSDHGDDLYEPGVTLGHGLGFNGGDQTNHVPMVMKVPAVGARKFPQLVRMIDLAPTLAELAGVKPPKAWEGRSWAGWLRGTEEPKVRPYYGETGYPFIQFKEQGVKRPDLPPMDEMTFIDESFHYQFVLRKEFEQPVIDAKQRCLRTTRWKLVCTPTADGTRHFRLHHLPTDPHCERDVAAEHPEVLAAMCKALASWIDERKETMLDGIFPGGEPE